MSPKKRPISSLRAIGQALESLKIDRFELEPDGKDFVIYAYARPNEFSVDQAAQENPVTTVWGYSDGSESEVATQVPKVNPGSRMELRYTAGDVYRLELAGRADRRDDSAAGDPSRLSQLMRIIAAYLDEKRGRLLQMTGRGDAIWVRYQPSAGPPVEELLSAAVLYEFWATLYVRRASRSFAS